MHIVSALVFLLCNENLNSFLARVWNSIQGRKLYVEIRYSSPLNYYLLKGLSDCNFMDKDLNEVCKDKFQWHWKNILDPKTRDKRHFDHDKDNISSEESEKRIHKCCLMTGALMNLMLLSLVLSLHILSIDLDIMIIEPKIGRDKYCKQNV